MRLKHCDKLNWALESWWNKIVLRYKTGRIRFNTKLGWRPSCLKDRMLEINVSLLSANQN